MALSPYTVFLPFLMHRKILCSFPFRFSSSSAVLVTTNTRNNAVSFCKTHYHEQCDGLPGHCRSRAASLG